MKKIAAVRAVAPDIPNLPFGFINDRWERFKSNIRPGDQLVSYSTSKTAWRKRAGESGYAIIRSACVVEVFTTVQS